MSLSNTLIVHAITLLSAEYAGSDMEEMRNVNERRSVSAAYYALFHHINEAAVSLIALNVSISTNHRIQRWFEHSEIKRVCGRFVKAKLDQPLLGLIGEAASDNLQNVARSFIELQEARHSADYDLSYILGSAEARQLIKQTVLAMGSWNELIGSAEANIFILSLLMWKNWDKERQS